MNTKDPMRWRVEQMNLGEVRRTHAWLAELGEGPVWDSRTQELYWVDIVNKKMIKQTVAGELEIRELPDLIGSMAPRASGGFVVATQKGFHGYDWNTEELTPIADPEAHKPNHRFNDGKCDPLGRFWAGSLSMLNEWKSSGLYRLNADHSVDIMLEGVSLSNGLAWSPDQSKFYYIDTPTQCVVGYDYDTASGHIDNAQVLFRISGEEGYPDGMTIDSEGYLWVAHWGGAQVSRWNPHTGAKVGLVKLPVPNATSCTFGGVNGMTLYITTARVGMSEEDLALYPDSGALFEVETSVIGGPTFTFAG
jgi:sugar lactone lactonase YvrE